MNNMRIRKLVLATSLLILLLLVCGCARKTGEVAAQDQDVSEGLTFVVPSDTSEPQSIPTTAAPAPAEAGEPAGGEPTQEPPGGDQPTQAPPSGDQPTQEPGGGEQPTDEPPPPPPAATPTGPYPTIPPPPAGDPGGGGGNPPPETTQGAPPPEVPGDDSGPQSELSDYEQAAQAAGNAAYTGLRCRVDMHTHTCNCTSATITSQFTFSSPNDMTWTTTSSQGSATLAMVRKGVNTWTGTIAAVDSIVIHVEIVFTATGYQQIATTVFTDGQSVTCPMIWTRL